MEKEEKKKPEEYVKNINKIIDYYNNFKDSNVTKESIKETREELFTRVFTKKEVFGINADLEIELPNNKTYKLKDYKNLEELDYLLENSKDAFSFLLYSKNKKESYTLDIIGFIILSLIALGFIYAGKYLSGIIVFIWFISLYLVTFLKDKKSSQK